MGGGPRARDNLKAVADEAAYFDLIRAEDDYIRTYTLPSSLNHGDLNDRIWNFVDPLIKLESQYKDLTLEIVNIFKLLILQTQNWIQNNRNQFGLIDPVEAGSTFPPIYKTLHGITTNQIKRLEELVKRAKNMGRRVMQDSELPETPEVSRVPEPEIHHSTRLFFIGWVEEIVKRNETMMEKLKGCFDAAKELYLELGDKILDN